MGLKFAPEVQDFVRTLAPMPKKRIQEALAILKDDPRADGLDVKVLKKDGAERFFRVRLGAYGIVYSRRGSTTFVWRIMHRSEGYAWLDRLDP